MLKKIALILILITLIEGCKKYPDDEHIHLFTALHRLTNHTWVVRKWENVNSYSFYFSAPIRDEFITFYKNGNCEGGGSRELVNGNGNIFVDPYLFNFNGTWEFLEHKSKIKVSHNQNHYSVWEIYQLDRKALVIANDSIKYYFENP